MRFIWAPGEVVWIDLKIVSVSYGKLLMISLLNRVRTTSDRVNSREQVSANGQHLPPVIGRSTPHSQD